MASTETPARAMTNGVENWSASGPETSDGPSDAALTIDARTPKTRPRTSPGVDFEQRRLGRDRGDRVGRPGDEREDDDQRQGSEFEARRPR